MDEQLSKLQKRFFDGDEQSGVELRTLLSRKGLEASQIIQEFIALTAKQIKGLVLEEVNRIPECNVDRITETAFIFEDPNLQIMRSYYGHIVRKPGIVLHTGTGHLDRTVILLNDGIFSFDRRSVRLILANNGKIEESDRDSHIAPILSTKKEEPILYLQYGEAAIKQFISHRNYTLQKHS